ncbi:MAG: hypothetical protein ACFFBD_17490, partial [Candidatus Hodarchaeota archaeon]
RGGAGDCFVTKLSYFGFFNPTGRETLTGIVTVQWTPVSDSTGLPVTYSLYYSSDNGTSWVIVASNLTNPNCQWDTTRVPNGSNYLLKVVATDSTGNTMLEVTNSTFKIQNPPTIIYPNGGEVLNGSVTVQWSAMSNSSGIFYSLFYSSDAGTTWYALATDLGVSIYAWDTTSVPDGSSYLLKVMAINATGHIREDTSDNTFSIQNTPSSSTTPSSTHTSESGIPTTASPGWTIRIFLTLILTVVIYRKYKQRCMKGNKLHKNT